MFFNVFILGVNIFYIHGGDNFCMLSTGFLLSSEFLIESLPWSVAANLALLLSTSVSSLLSAMSSQSLRSSQSGLLVPFACTSSKQSRTLSLVGPSTWNGLPSQLRIFPRASSPAFFLTSRPLLLAAQELGELLSSLLEEVLYKCSI